MISALTSLVITVCFGCGKLWAASIDEYVGNWNGDGHYYDAPMTCTQDTFTETIAMNLSIQGNNLVGSIGVSGNPPLTIQGTILNGIFTFPLPTDTPQHPDCTQWDVTGKAFLDSTGRTLSLIAEGTFCGEGGGKPAIFSGTLSKNFTAAPMMLLLNQEQ
jgi:hypothetical protein